MRIVKLTLALSVLAGSASSAYAGIDIPGVIEETTGVAQSATCRTISSAILAYATDHDTPPRSITDLRPYVDGDLTGYALVEGKVTGPGCR